MGQAIIIFVKNPEIGKVKTRLASTLGDQKALDIYIDLMKYTSELTRQVKADRYVFYSSNIPETDEIWPESYFHKQLQKGENLGERMLNAFKTLFSKRYDKIVIIGSDCAELESEHIKEAFEQLEQVDAVIGPAKDGGYYLLGLSELIEALFKNKMWSADSVFDSTLSDFMAHHLIWHELPILSDIDNEEDWKMHAIKLLLKNATKAKDIV